MNLFTNIKKRLIFLSFGKFSLCCLYRLAFFFLIVSLSFLSIAHAQIASGTYTIGGASPNYASFTAAVSDLNTNGLTGNGPVIFNVRNGTYTENLTINQITNANATNTITFKSENSDSTFVTLTHATAAYTIVLNGADYITFKWMTIQTTGAHGVCEILGGATNNTFTNCRINGYSSTGTAYAYALFYSTSTATLDDNNKFFNNVMTQGSIAIVFLGSGTNTETGMEISRNQFVNQGGYCLQLNYQDGVIISHNSITTNLNATHYGIYLNYCDGAVEIKYNKFWKTTAGQGYGLYLSQCKATVGSPGHVYNNFFYQIGTSGNGYGIYSTFSDYYNFYFNNISNTHTNTTQSAFYITGGGTATINIKNNIFSNTGGGYAIYIATTAAIAAINYNDYHFTGTNLGYWSANKTTLAAWQTATGSDANSLSTNPLYTDPANGDLHIGESTLQGAGTNIASVTDDFDGNVRPSPPTIGAHETGTGASNDAGVISIDQPVAPFTSGNQNVYITIKNFSPVTLTSATLNWKVNNVPQPDYNWTGSLASNTSSSSFSIGLYSFTANTNHTIEVWTTLPNGAADGNTGNDKTTRVNVTPALTGTYTIGASGDFSTFSPAVDSIINHGIVGAVTFSVQAETYSEQISIPEIMGSSAVNTITFQSQSGDSSDVILQYASQTGVADNYCVQLNGADYITFKKITIQRTGTNNYARVVAITGNSHDNHFENNQLFGISGGSGDSRAVIYSGSESIDDTANVFDRNWILNGYMGIFIEGSSGNLKRTVTIQNNKLENYRYGIYCSYLENLEIYKNEIINAATTNGAATQGMYLFHCDSMLKVRKNEITVTAGTNNYGIEFLSCETSYTGTNSPGEISNNMITVGGTGTSYGIYSNGTMNKNFYYNTIFTTGTNPTSSRSFYVNGPYSGTPSLNANFTVKNNVFVASSGTVIYNSVGGIIACNYNNYYVTAATDIGYWDGITVSNLSELQTANSDDANSISSDPLFVSGSAPFDLHIQSGSPCIDQALVIGGLGDDIDDDVRAPDIGADEFGSVQPITLLYFKGRYADNIIFITWATATEINNDYFTIERSLNGHVFESIGVKKGAGNSSSVLNYEFVDTELHLPDATANLYYRLKQTDYDGKYSYSNIIAFSNSEKENDIVQLFPNPVTNVLSVAISGRDEFDFYIRMTDVFGLEMINKEYFFNKESNLVQVDMSGMNSGIYFLMVNVKGENSNKTFLKKVVKTGN